MKGRGNSGRLEGERWVGWLILRGNNNHVGQAIHHHLQLPRLTEIVCLKPLGTFESASAGYAPDLNRDKANYLHPGDSTNSS